MKYESKKESLYIKNFFKEILHINYVVMRGKAKGIPGKEVFRCFFFRIKAILTPEPQKNTGEEVFCRGEEDFWRRKRGKGRRYRRKGREGRDGKGALNGVPQRTVRAGKRFSLEN